MIIRNNAGSRWAGRYLSAAQTKTSQTLEKLSSGYRINRSADDAAGLAISEKMRLNITGLGRAKLNSIEGSRLIQTGEGALQEIQDMLDRAEYLAVQSANGVYQDELDRENLQKELEHLCSEIDRISKGANFNGIELFQDVGLEHERGAPRELTVPSAPEALVPESAPEEARQLPEVRVYTIEHDVEATQRPSGTTTGDIQVPGGAGNVSLGQVLRDEIVPNTVRNILRSYTAFSYLDGSQIGIGLNCYADGTSSVLASVKATAVYSDPGTMKYQLNINTAKIDTTQADWRSSLEATIAHEMTHAFMDEATTAGMMGKSFPMWFVEGMAQTASGPDNWVASMGITATSTDAEILAAIKSAPLRSSATNGTSQYGTGYLACMYLGAAIANGGTPGTQVDAHTVLVGLNKLLNEVIGGKSLDSAINTLTNGTFTSHTDFQTKFDGGTATGLGEFTRKLLTASQGGLGGLASGDLAASDLADDTKISDEPLFKLDKDHTDVTNTYPAGYPIQTGGTATTDGVAPSGFQPAMPYKDYGGLRVYGAKDSDIEYNSTTKTLTVKAGGGIKISMANPADTAAVVEKIILGETGGSGTVGVLLDGVKLGGGSGGTLEVKQNAEIRYETDTSFGSVDLAQGVSASIAGTAALKAGTFKSDTTNTVSFTGGAVIVDNGNGSITAGTVHVDGAVIAATAITQEPAGKASIDVPFASELSGFGDITSIMIDGKKYDLSLDDGQANAKLWLDTGSDHRIVFTNDQGVSKPLAAEREMGVDGTTFDHFKWTVPLTPRPFTVSGGDEGVDWTYDSDGKTLLILKGDKPLTIGAGHSVDENGNALVGRIKVQDNIGAVDLTLEGITTKVSTGQAFALGEGNNVSITLADGTTNVLQSGSGFAGLSVGSNTNLTINGPGALAATGGYNGAGIGRDYTSRTGLTGSITIEGGTITATGGESGAGIGAARNTDFGNITIKGGTITASGGEGGAGIGGSIYAKVGDIEIKDATVIATSKGHGAGIGGGWTSTATNGTITIGGTSKVRASSPTHGTGIGAGCQGTSGTITIQDDAVIEYAEGGDQGAGIGASWIGTCGDIIIKDRASVIEAKGGNKGAGIGSGSNGSNAGNIVIDTTGTVSAEGGTNGVGIGSGYGTGGRVNGCGDIEIKQGVVIAKGNTDSTGIGAGRGSTSGNITIGDVSSPTNKVVVSAQGGMTNNGGNIMSYTDKDHKTSGTITITGQGTSVRPGEAGEGLYSTSGVDGGQLYSYPLCIFKDADQNAQPDPLLDASIAKGGGVLDYIPLPENAKITGIKAVGADGTATEWSSDITHDPAGDPNYVYLWMTPQNQTLTIEYTDGSGTAQTPVTLNLTYFPDAGVFRVKAEQDDPPAAQPPEYTTNPGGDPDPPEVPPPPSGPSVPSRPRPDPKPEEPEPEPEPEKPLGPGGIILQIGANYGEILEVPRFYLSARALGLNGVDISTQQNAWDSIPVLREAVNRVSSIRGEYGALQNRLEHNQSDLSQSVENLTDAESRIRDADMAEEYTKLVKLNILQQSAQSMLAHSNQNAGQVMQLLQ